MGDVDISFDFGPLSDEELEVVRAHAVSISHVRCNNIGLRLMATIDALKKRVLELEEELDNAQYEMNEAIDRSFYDMEEER